MSWEVKAMKSKTSLFSPTLFRKNLTRFAPLWAIFLALMILNGPVAFLRNRAVFMDDAPFIVLSGFFSSRVITAVLINFLYAPLCAGMLFHYLHSTRSAYMMHAFPLNRSTQFITNAVSGFAFAVVPFLVELALNLLASVGMPGQSFLWKLLAVEILSFVFFYGLAVFCMQITGNSIISVLSYAILNFVFAAVPVMFVELLDMISFGFDTGTFMTNLSWLAPIVQMLTLDILESPDAVEWAAFCIYGLLGCVLLALSWLQYRARHLEQAGEAMISRWSRIGFLLLFTVFCTLGVGLILSVLLCDTVAPWRSWLVPMLLFFLFASFVGWFGAQMMLKRTVRVFHKRQVLGWVCAAAITVTLICGIHFDVLGIQRYVPARTDLQEATLVLSTHNSNWPDGLDARLTVKDPELLDVVLESHGAAYDHYRSTGRSLEEELTVIYRLNSGRRVTRRISMTKGTALHLSRLLSSPEYCVDYYDDLLTKVPLNNSVLSLSQYSGDKYYENILCDRNALREAIARDAAEGNLKIPFVFEDPFEWQLQEGSTWICLPDEAAHTLAVLGVKH